MQSKSNKFNAGTLEIEVVNKQIIDGKTVYERTKFVPNSARIGINFGDVAYSIQFSMPSISKYFFGIKDGNEVKVYIDGEFYAGGYFVSRNSQNNSWSYNCLGYGFEINKSFCFSLTSFKKNMNVGTFILQTIRENLKKRNQKIFIKNTITKQSQIGIVDSSISFVLYDPSNYGDEIVVPATESKSEESILSYLNKFLKPKNLFIRCLGELNDIRDSIRLEVLNNRINNNILSIAIQEKKKVFVLELYKATTSQTGSSLTLDYTKKTDFSIKSKGNIFDNVINQQAKFKIDYSNRYGCYFATSKNQPNVDTGTNDAYALDPVISDGTAKVIKFDLNLDINGLQDLLNYEVNKRIAESFEYSCTVIGFRQGLNINNVNNGIEKTILAFWDINQNVQVTDINNGINDNQFLIKSVILNWDKTGAKTNLVCTLPNSYSLQDPAKLETEYLEEVIREEERKEEIFLHKPGYYLRDINPKHKARVGL